MGSNPCDEHRIELLCYLKTKTEIKNKQKQTKQNKTKKI